MKVQECCCLYLNFKKSKPALHFVSISQVRFAYGEKHMHAITENNISSQSRLGASSQNNNETNVKIMKTRNRSRDCYNILFKRYHDGTFIIYFIFFCFKACFLVFWSTSGRSDISLDFFTFLGDFGATTVVE